MVMSALAPLNSAPLNCAPNSFLRHGSNKREAPRDKPVASARCDFCKELFIVPCSALDSTAFGYVGNF
jgi:hypothetical protein